MKQDKVFVRHKHFNQGHPYTRDRQAKKPQADKKKYAEKSNKVRQVVRQIIDSFQPLQEIPKNVSLIIEKFPKFFNKKSYGGEKDQNETLNEYVIFNAKKYLESLQYGKKQHQATHSSSDPDWNSDDQVDGNMESKHIDVAIIEKIVEKYADQPIKKHQILKRHEKQFLEDYFRTKRLRQQQESQDLIASGAKIQTNTKITTIPDKKNGSKPQEGDKLNEKPKNIWSQYQQKQVNSFVDMGFMTKIEDNQEDIEAQLVQDNEMFCDDEELKELKEEGEKSQSDSQGDEDIFGDQCPTTTVKTKPSSDPKIESQKVIGQGTVVINTQVFSKIAEQVGLLPARCNWIISNENEKYKVSSEYMDLYYRKEKINEILPYISLNHSEFVRNDEIQTQKALDTFRKFNSRREKKYPYTPVREGRGTKSQYKQKANTHLLKK